MIANFEGTLNAATVNCSVTNSQGIRVTTQWTLGNFRGSDAFVTINNVAPELLRLSGDPVPGFNYTYENSLTVTNLTSVLDGVVVYCGTGLQAQQGKFTLRIYRKFTGNSKCIHVYVY